MVAYGGGFPPRQDHNINSWINTLDDCPTFAAVFRMIRCWGKHFLERLTKTLANDTLDAVSAHSMPVHLP